MSRKARRLAKFRPNLHKLQSIRQKVALLASYAEIRNDSAIVFNLKPYRIYMLPNPPMSNLDRDYESLANYFRGVTKDLSAYAQDLRASEGLAQ